MSQDNIDNYSWEQVARKTLVDSKFIKVYEDTVKIPNQDIIIDDYTVVVLNSPVLVVATNDQNEVLILNEYRYAHNTVMPSVPAGAIDAGETPVQAAERELLEETGYTAQSFEYVGQLHEYPTKLSHITHVVRATGLKKISEPRYEITEFVESTELIAIDKIREMIKQNEIKTAVIISALYLSLEGL